MARGGNGVVVAAKVRAAETIGGHTARPKNLERVRHLPALNLLGEQGVVVVDISVHRELDAVIGQTTNQPRVAPQYHRGDRKRGVAAEVAQGRDIGAQVLVDLCRRDAEAIDNGTDAPNEGTA